MIKGIQAFEACWINLRSSYPTGPAQNLLIAQAMGRVTDHYGTVEEIEQSLPADLQVLFRTLIHAYFHGYALNNTPTINADAAVITERTQAVRSTRKSQVGGETTRKEDSGSCSLANKTGRSLHHSANDFWRKKRNEAETLIIEIPFADYMDVK